MQVAYAWAVGLGGDNGAALLQQLGLAEAAVEYAIEVGAFAHAFQLAEGAAKGKLPEVHLKYAMYLEDSGRFEEAENEFLNAGVCGGVMPDFQILQDADHALVLIALLEMS